MLKSGGGGGGGSTVTETETERDMLPLMPVTVTAKSAGAYGGKPASSVKAAVSLTFGASEITLGVVVAVKPPGPKTTRLRVMSPLNPLKPARVIVSLTDVPD